MFDPRRLSRKKSKNKAKSHVEEPVTLNHLKTTMREIRSLRVIPIRKRSEAKLDTLVLGISSEVLTYSGKYVRFSGGECGVSSSLGGRSSGSYLLGNIFSTNGNDFTRVRACLNPIRPCGTGRYGTRLSHSHNVPHRTPGIGLYSEPDQAGVMVLLGGWLPV